MPNLTASPQDIIRIAGTVIVLALAFVTVRHRRESGAWAVTGLLVSIAVWLGSSVLSAASGQSPQAVVWGKLLYTAAPFVVLFLFLFVLRYTGNDEYITPRTLALLAIEPAVVTVAVWTNQFHHLFWRDLQFVSGGYWHFQMTMGPVFHANVAYSYLLVLVGIGLVVRLLQVSQSLYPGQVYAVLAAILAPFVTDLVRQFGDLPISLTPVAFTFSGLVVTMAIFRFKLLDISPVAQDSVVENIRDGLFVLDRDDEFVEINSVAREYLDLEAEQVVGRSFADVLTDYPELFDEFADETDKESEVRVRTADSERFFHVQVTPLTDHRDELIGRQFLIHDVTERVARKRELERQNEQLDRFASVVSHDLRNPLNVASGRVELLREEIDDQHGHVDAIQQSHYRMERLIDDMLTLARDGQTISETERVSLPSVANAAWENVTTRDATLTLGTALSLEADEARLCRLFENLFRNAVEHSSTAPQSQAPEDAVERGSTSLTIEIGALTGPADRRPVGFYVADDGPGIPPEQRDRVLEDGFTTDDDGTGLGLSIVASIVDAHGWTIDVTESDQGGARFEIRDVTSARQAERAAEHSS
ncbi:histidine kinase N-terminal 7TM domain-containing protein [Halorientalis brevis]|uniref:histidine kinase n=1 Tax=Halorientalis brevis TaxID=1126241 RepID=A0ABD6CD85_9EURY|nr:histidine kinase N-terminal 7TM domain-containing protein [Halorientalis brevis]